MAVALPGWQSLTLSCVSQSNISSIHHLNYLSSTAAVEAPWWGGHCQCFVSTCPAHYNITCDTWPQTTMIYGLLEHISTPTGMFYVLELSANHNRIDSSITNRQNSETAPCLMSDSNECCVAAQQAVVSSKWCLVNEDGPSMRFISRIFWWSILTLSWTLDWRLLTLTWWSWPSIVTTVSWQFVMIGSRPVYPPASLHQEQNQLSTLWRQLPVKTF